MTLLRTGFHLMNNKVRILVAGVLLLGTILARAQNSGSGDGRFLSGAPRPPLGWNSWDCFASTVRFYVFTNQPFAPELSAPVPVELANLGSSGPVQIRDLLRREALGSYADLFAPTILPHGAGLYRLSTQVKTPTPAPGRKPTLFLIGDSTVKNGSGRGDGGLHGWGQVLPEHFDPNRIMIENRARGGRSSRTYLTEGLWDGVLADVQPGDFVMMQFGHNDGGPMDEGRARASIKGVGPESRVITNKNNGVVETVYTYGWYLRKYIADTKAKGATAIVLSPVPRNIWKEDHVARASSDYGQWAAAAARKGGALFIDLNELVSQRYEKAGRDTVAAEYFTATDHTHTTLKGAKVNAEAVVEGIEQLAGCPLREALTETSGTANP